MKKVLWYTFALLQCCNYAQAQSPPSSPAELAEIAARGRTLSEYDTAAWHATDAVMELKPAQGAVELYIGRKTPKGWVVAWGRFNETHTRFLVTYEAQQQDGFKYTVIKHQPPLEDSDWYLRAAKAQKLAVHEFVTGMQPRRRYNLAILPAPDSDWYVYALPAQAENNVLPYGGDMRYTVSADGTRITGRRQMHRMVLEDRLGNAEFGFHTHILSDVPEDSDVFYALSRKAANGEWIATSKYIYEINVQGQLRYLGKTDEIMDGLQHGKWTAVPVVFRPMVLASVRRINHEDTAATPVEAFISFAGAHCENHTVLLKFSVALHNASDTRVVVSKYALQNAGVRFAETEAKLAAGKFSWLMSYGPPDDVAMSDSSFSVMGPGMIFTQDREFPIQGLDLKSQTAVQILFFSWPMGKEAEIAAQQSHWATTGILFSGQLISNTIPFNVAPELLEACAKK